MPDIFYAKAPIYLPNLKKNMNDNEFSEPCDWVLWKNEC
jgi:hypothetical protein